MYVRLLTTSPKAQWLERPTGTWKATGSTPVGGLEKSFSEYFDLRMLLHYLHFIQVTNPFIEFHVDSYIVQKRSIIS